MSRLNDSIVMRIGGCGNKGVLVGFACRFLLLCFLAGLPFARPSTAASFISTEGSFQDAVGASQSFLNEFSDLVEENPYAHPLTYSSNGLAYAITSTPVFEIYSRPGFVSTASTNAEIVVTFTGANVRAAGGLVFLTDAFGASTNGQMRVVLDGTNTNTLSVVNGGPAFAGYFTATMPFSSLRISSESTDCYPALDHFLVAEGVPVLTMTAMDSTTVTIRWPAPATGYVLQAATSLLNPDWTQVQETRQSNGDFWEVTLPRQGTALFFRLIRE